MRTAWTGGDVLLIEDATARHTSGNASSVAETARRLDATQVTVVTSRWHAVRARALVRVALPETPVRVSSPGARPPVALFMRELGCLAVLPYQLIRMRASSGKA